MKRIILFLFLFTSFLSGQSGPNPEIYGLWKNLDGEYVSIQLDNTFQRFEIDPITKQRIPISNGTLEVVNDELHIVRRDTIDNYKLGFFVNMTTMVITKPRSRRAWLWFKIGN